MSSYNTQNARWLRGSFPALYRQIQEFPWVQDGLSERERETVDDLLYIGASNIANLEATLELAWVRDGISETEGDAIRWLQSLNYNDQEAASAVIAMPFLATLEYDDVLAIRGMGRLAYNSQLSAVTETSAWQEGLTDAHTILVSAAATLNDRQEISRIMNPGYAAVETAYRPTELTPALKISIVRAGTESRPATIGHVEDAVKFAERTMQLPLPVSHVILVLNDNAVTTDFAGTNHGHAISYKPEYEAGQTPYDELHFLRGIIHEVAHYFWRGNEDWIDEGLANTFEYLHQRGKVSPGLLEPQREDCETSDLQTLVSLNPDKSDKQFLCNYYLGEMLFRELLESMGQEPFIEKLRELYRLSKEIQDTDYDPGITEVRQVFHAQSEIVEKHWSGKLNAPGKRPYDEVAWGRNLGLVKWITYPTYESGTVKLEGEMQGEAVFQHVDLKNPAHGQSYYPNFIIVNARNGAFVGAILPGNGWILDPEDAAAAQHHYYPATRRFIVTFQFPKILGNPADYGVVVLGYENSDRTSFFGHSTDRLGYARIRAP